ncbi:MAG: hypothetical protein LH473_12380, partial [Chitinophagales bacterium]|nr:hypothetical protein [Chitinophagales bacterium]
MKLIFTSIILFFSICFCNAAIVTGLTGFYRHGQVFLTWQNVSNLSTYYKVYRSTSPITSSSQLGTCEYLGYTDSYSSKDISLSAQDSTTKYLRIDSAGIPLPSTTGLFVATTLVNGNYFYAVTTLLSSVEDVTVTVSSNSLTSAITELVNKPMPVYQEYRIISKDTVEIYTTFLSSKYAIDSPLMNNAGFMDFDFAVARNHPDGTLRPIRIRLHGGGALFLEKMAVFTENEINLNVEDKLPSGEKTGFWGLNSNFNIYDDSYNTPWKDGVNYNHTQRRIIDAVDWAIANLQVDTNRIYLESSSMGSPGAYFMGVTYPERFAAINLSAGLFNFAFDSDYQSNCSMNTNKSNRKEGDDRFGKIGTNLPSNLSIGTYQALNGGALIHLDPNRDYPFFYSINGKKDKVMGWTEKTFYYDSVNNNYAGGWYFYDQRQHNGLDGIWDGNNFDMFRYSKAISYPAISNCSLNEDWGDGDGSSGDSYGTVNGSIDWLPPSKDNATNYEIKLFIRDLSKSDGTFKVYADSCTATIVPRRLQGFHVATGATVYWSITHKGNVIQSGSIVKENGIMIFPLIKIYKDSVLFKLTLSVATYYQDNDDDGYGNPSVSIVAALQPIGYVLNANDCNDSNALINPGTNEVCNTVDDNCNGSIDEGLIQFTYYVDSDGDSYGNLSSSISTCSSNVPIGYALSSNDCNDENTAIHPNATEVCNMIDDDCNTLIDENNSIVAT